MQKYLVELIGTFFLVLTIGLAVIEPGAGAFAPIAIGSILMVMVFAGGHISGGHFNPAVTLAVFIRGKCDTKDVVPYWVSQVAGALLAAVIVKYLKSGAVVVAGSPEVGPALVAEFLFTFALAYVVLQTATSPDNEGNSFYGLAIGFTVMVGAFTVGGISGGVFNPAVGVGVSVMGLSAWGSLWIFLVANLGGAAAAAVLYKYVDGQ